MPKEEMSVNPSIEALPSGFEKEQIKPAEYSDPSSFRTLCPECPGQRCSFIDLFAEPGGLSLGFKKSGCKHILGIEFDPKMAETYRRN